MGLSERDRQRYARHLLLAQLGEAGQARLLSAAVHAPEDADAGALEVAQSYLERAGVRVVVHDSLAEHGTSAEPLTLPTGQQIAQIAGDPALQEAARALTGALSAVQAVQRAAGLAGAASVPFTASQFFAISSEDA
jgi:hypothetical protein